MRKITLLVIAMLIFVSCTKDVDFNQANDIQISPAVELSLIYTQAYASNFLVNGVEVATTETDFIEVDIFNDQFINDNVTKVDLHFETENTLPREFLFNVNFYSETGAYLHTYSFTTQEESPHIATFEDNNLNIIKNTNILEFTITLLSGEPLTEDTPGSISLQSKAIFYFNIES
ncbi:hypothetical protein [Neotamlana laminarinivorans]|uniref:DUF4625 domain-containing protein n=1 Tax=Neotamlana laminarinivorans TaxID=2883124 RepID=A0A9X1L5C0_9FLAO|nr:hypothetical protein [Tamlana laminarinivorans]MCB4799226.1 hypothetical protein [Tamlana laminarinivorans]